MPTFMDFHDDLKLPQEAIDSIGQGAKNGDKDEFGVRQIELYHNADGKVYCLLEAPDEESVRKHHAALDVPCGQGRHAHLLADFPRCRLWFNDGTNEHGKVVANPNIGYGVSTITYADGSSREFYRIGLSANTTGISVYVLGLDDKRPGLVVRRCPSSRAAAGAPTTLVTV